MTSAGMLLGAGLDAVDTPALIVDMNVMEANVASMALLARESGLVLLPHVKSHKTPALAWLQIRAGASGVTCQKLGEAVVMADAGIREILLATPVVGPIKTRRFVHLSQMASVTSVVDSEDGARLLSAELVSSGLCADVLIAIDVGYRRGGVGVEQATQLANVIRFDLPGLRVVGVMAYEGQLYDYRSAEAVAVEARKAYSLLGDVADAIRAGGTAIRRVSVGASAGARVAGAHPAVTELRAGSYLFNDRSQIAMGSADESECALTVLATVVSTPSSDRAVIDAGAKALGNAELPGVPGFGLMREHGDSVLERLADEHGIVNVVGGARPFRVGERIRVIPNSHTLAVNQFSELVGVRGDTVEWVWSIAARGQSQ
jgi:D-serine deaminase-like pyridoxal phosphate-dependent protein